MAIRPFFVLLLTLSLFSVAVMGCDKQTQTKRDTLPTTPRILIVLTSHSQLGETGKPTGFYLSEASHPHEVFKSAGFAVDFASIQGGKPPMDGVKRDDPVNVKFLEDPKVKAKLNQTPKLKDIDPSKYQAIFFAGGHGTMWDFPTNDALQRITAKMYESGKVVAAVCHGPAALVNVKLNNGQYLVQSKRVAGFTNEEERAVELTNIVPFLLESRLKARGAIIDKAENFKAKVVVSERLVTGQNPASATGVAKEVVKLLKK